MNNTDHIDEILVRYWLTATSSSIRSPQRYAHYEATEALKSLLLSEAVEVGDITEGIGITKYVKAIPIEAINRLFGEEE